MNDSLATSSTSDGAGGSDQSRRTCVAIDHFAGEFFYFTTGKEGMG